MDPVIGVVATTLPSRWTSTFDPTAPDHVRSAVRFPLTLYARTLSVIAPGVGVGVGVAAGVGVGRRWRRRHVM